MNKPRQWTSTFNVFLIRTFSFFFKEVKEIYRQPRLILSLILGPLIILVLFGMGYQSTPPRWKTVLVIPDEIREYVPIEELEYAFLTNFNLVAIRDDATEARAQLNRGEIDVVVTVPEDIQDRIRHGSRSPITFTYNEINPFNEQGIRYLAYAQVNEINRALLLHATRYAQQEADNTRNLLVDVRLNLEQIQSGITSAQRANMQDLLAELRYSIDMLITNPFPLLLLNPRESNIAQIRQNLRLLRQDLITIEKALNNDTLDEQALHIIATRDRISTIEEEVTTWTTVPPEVIISPLQHSHENLQGDSLNFMSYYAPGVFALILQHIAIMLGALSLVRERETGAFEHYRVTPVSMLQILIGKYLSYIILIGSIAVVLLLLITGVLGVPFFGRVADAAGVIFLFLLATLGIGFFISTIARSDNQAVQFSMLALLLSIFFSGLLLPLEYFSQTFRMVSYLLPLTHCIIGLQDLMLRGVAPEPFTWGSLLSMSAATLGIVIMLAHRQFLRVV